MSNIIENFKLAQTFYIDRGAVKNAAAVGLTAIDLFFRRKPYRKPDQSSEFMPGVTIFLCPVKENDIPDIDNVIRFSEVSLEYDEIVISSDASSETTFAFSRPIVVPTDRAYALIVCTDANDTGYELWKSVEGDILVGTTNTVAGPAGQYIGKYFDYVKSANSSTTAWNSLSTTDIKFNVYCARYQYDEETAEPFFGRSSFVLPKKNYEFILFDRKLSRNITVIEPGEYVYQNSVIQSYTIRVRSDSQNVYTTDGNFSTLYAADTDDTQDQYIVIYDTGGTKNIRQVIDIVSNTQIIIDSPTTFSNSIATFSKPPVGIIEKVSDTLMYGTTENLLVITDSNANSDVRFSNNVVEAVTIVNGGSGYSNTDYIMIFNGANSTTNSAVNARANVVTDGSGTITSVRLSNAGVGFLNYSPSFSVLNSSDAASSGTSANFTFTIGATLHTELSNAVFSNVELVNIGMNGITVGAAELENPAGTTLDIKLNHLYFENGQNIIDITILNGGSGYANNERFIVTGSPTGSGASGYIRTDSTGMIVDCVMQAGGNNYTGTTAVTVSTSGGTGANLEAIVGTFRYTANAENEFTDRYISILRRNDLPYSSMPQIMSRSYEVTQTPLNYTTATGQTYSTSVSSLIELIVSSNNEYLAPEILDGEIDINYERYAINNTYKNEHLGYGDAASKHVSTKINFTDSRTAEDLRVYFRAYRPRFTDIKAYARIHNAKDNEPFDDKNWTLLTYKTNENVYSSSTNENDFIEYELGFPQYPNTQFTCVGTANVAVNNTTITGSGTNFQTGTNSLAVNDVIKVYSPLFPENYFIAVVDSIASNTSLTINQAVSNNSYVGSGLLIDKIEYPNQAFNNSLNGNMVRYYNSQLNEFDGYNTFAIKLVLLSSSSGIVPKIDDTTGIGVTV